MRSSAPSSPYFTDPPAADAEAPPARNRGWDSWAGGAGQGGGALAARAVGASASVPSPGLVHSDTSGQTEESRGFQAIDVVARRLGRMRRKVKSAARYFAQLRGEFDYAAFVTLTYRDDVEWGPRHVSDFLLHVRRHLARERITFRYVWVLELTKRGRPHFHCMIWLPHGVKIPKPDQAGWWPHGMTKIERARDSIGYLMKYASKGLDGEDLPRGARICGAGGLYRLGRRFVRYWLLPRYVRTHFDHGVPESGVICDVHRLRGGGWASLETGEWIPAVLPIRDAAGVLHWPES